METRIGRIILALAITVTTAACGGEGGDGGEKPVSNGSFATVVEPVLGEHCSGCHSFTREMLLETTSTCLEDGEPVEKPLVKPGDPEGSILWMKIANISESFAYGNMMPPTGEGGLIEIDPAAFEALEKWIADGAPE